jgi:hypothetical protein
MIFAITVLAGVGVFFYVGYLSKSIDSANASLDEKKDDLNPDDINRMVRLDTRLDTAEKLVNSHVSVSRIFDLLEDITLPSVRFTSFDFNYLGTGKVSMKLKGQSTGFTGVALQSDILNKEKTFKKPIISDLALEASGAVTFVLSTDIDADIVDFKRYVVGGLNNAPSEETETASSTVENDLNSLDADLEAITNGL